MGNVPANRHPAFVAVGFGLDEGIALSLTNLAGQAVNSTELADVPRPRPIEGSEQSILALTMSSTLRQLPLVVRELESRDRLFTLIGKDAVGRVCVIDEFEQNALEQRREVPEIWLRGQARRSSDRQEFSMSEARVLSGRLFYALNGLSVEQRGRVADWAVCGALASGTPRPAPASS